MRLSKNFGTTLKTNSGDGDSFNYRLLVRGGFIQQVSAGVYSYLPLGLKVINRISQVVREEMNALGASELSLPSLQPKAPWQQTGRWTSFDVLYRLQDSAKREHALGPSHEEVITPLAQSFINSYKDLPAAAYQIQTKFRDELRPKSGLMRGREFLMKDLYSFHADAGDLDKYYETVKTAYAKVYHRLGLAAKLTEASGGAFTKYSHEYQVFTEAGEDTVYYCDHCDFAQNDEIATVKAGDACPSCKKGEIKSAKAAEVGNIFKLGDRFSKAFEFNYTAADGKSHHPVMGCYGIGISRIMGVLVEVHHDENGIVWPAEAAPADVHIVSIGADRDDSVANAADKLYDDLIKNGYEVIYDDRDATAGAKFADADLIGCPIRLTVSPKTLSEGSAELKYRHSEKAELITLAKAADPDKL